MSFGFSVGDFLAVGKLIADITTSLREAGGSKSEYQELLRELESLNHALKHLDKLSKNDASANIESIKYAALSCRRPLEQFLGKIEKYDKALGIWGGKNPIKKTADKLRWTFGEKVEIKKLQSYLNIHIGTFNILLAEHGLEKMNLASEKGELDQLHIRARLENTKSLMQWIKDSVIAQTAAVQNNNSMLMKLFGMVGGELGSSLKSLGEMVAKVCVSTQQIYGVVLEIRGSLTTPDSRWTFFQAPLIVEDALGFRFPVPSEYDFDLLNAIIKHRFLEGPGSSEVQADNYELVSAKNSQVVFSENVRLLPGASIIMAILLEKLANKVYTGETCPMPRCGSTLTTAAPGGGRICEQCNVWFDHSKKKRKLDLFLSDVDSEDDASIEDSSRSENLEGPPKVTDVEESLDCFKNVKLMEEILQDQSSATTPSLDGDTADKDRLVELHDALNFVDKHRFRDTPEAYKQFIEMLKIYKRKKQSTQELFPQMKKLLASTSDLLEGFERFLPDDAAIADFRNQHIQLEVEGDETVEAQVPVDDRRRKRARHGSTDDEGGGSAHGAADVTDWSQSVEPDEVSTG